MTVLKSSIVKHEYRDVMSWRTCLNFHEAV